MVITLELFINIEKVFLVMLVGWYWYIIFNPALF